MRKTNSVALALFLLGTFSMTQIRLIGNIGISEVFVFVVAPYWWIRDRMTLRRDRFGFIILLSLLTCLSCCVSSYLNGTPFPFVIRGIASPYAVFAWTVVLHRLLVKDLTAFRWLLVGAALTLIINTFVFQTGQRADGSINGEFGNAVEITMNNPLYWVSRLTPWITLPARGWYFTTPLSVSFLSALLLAVYTLVSSESGRSASAVMLAASFLLLIGGKSRKSMLRLKKTFLLVVISAVVVMGGFKKIYQALALNGTLGEKALKKYEVQTRMGSDVLSLLMGGRAEFFIGLFAALDKPLFGHGPWAVDTKRYVGDYLAKYGDADDYRIFVKNEDNMIMGSRGGMLLPTHSHLVGFWVWYGLIGLLLWVYVLYLCMKLFCRYLDAIPQWYGFFCLTVPASLWHIFFSPFGNRMLESLLIVTILLARAVSENKLRLPMKMEIEILSKDRSK